MKISRISKIVSLLLVLTLTGFTVAVVRSLQHLNHAFKAVEFVGQQQNQFYTRISQPVFNYLASGDATLLTDIDTNVGRAVRDIEANREVDDRLKAPFLDLLRTVQQSIVVELTSAGKLADPQILLINNEQQMSGHLQSLIDYASRAPVDAKTKQPYWELIGQTQAAVLNLSRARQSFFAAREAVSAENIQRYQRQLLALADRYKQLPLLGVMRDAANAEPDFGLGLTERVAEARDLAEEPISEIGALIRRYDIDLGSAEQFARQKAASRTQAAAQLQTLQQRFADLQTEIAGEYQYYEHILYTIVAICTAILIAICMLMIYIKRHLADVIAHISNHVDLLARGDLRGSVSLRSRIAEINLVKESLHKLQDYFESLIRHINQESSALNQYGRDILLVAASLESITADQRQATEAGAQQMTELHSSFVNVANSAADSQHATTSAHGLIDSGVAYMRHTQVQVAELAKATDETAASLEHLRRDAAGIETVLGVIQGFNDQINLLALNAAIEAARAGQYGRGFAVVADEVRKLASNTADSAEQIRGLIERLNRATETTVKLMNQQQAAAKTTAEAVDHVHQVFAGIKSSIGEVLSQSRVIAAASLQQSQVAERIANNFSHTAELAKQTTHEAQTNKLSASAISDVNQNLQNLIAQFKVA